MLKRNEALSSLAWEMLARKNIKKHETLVLRLEALYLVKNIFCLYFSPIPKLWSRKKVIFKFFVFWRYSKTLMHVKNSLHHFCLWHLFHGTLELRKSKNKSIKLDIWPILFNHFNLSLTWILECCTSIHDFRLRGQF